MEFDRVIPRRGTGSLKWERFSDDVLPLWVADMDFPAPPAVREALRRRVEHGVYGYARVPESLVNSISAYLRRRYDWEIDPEWLVFLPGTVPGLNLACRAVGRPGDEVMVVMPVYPPFLTAPELQERRLLAVSARQTDGSWELPLEAMEAAVTPATRLLLFCHPHNPLGRVWRKEELTKLVEFCRRHDLVLCSDELHCDLILDPLRHVPAATLPDAAGLTITLMSPSKTYNVAGLQFAYAIIPDPALRQAFRRAGAGFMEPDYPGWFGIAAAEAAYTGAGEWLEQLLSYLRGNRDLLESFVQERLPRVGITHAEATYLAWLDAGGLGLEEPVKACLRAGVALSDGVHFGARVGFLRLNFGCPRTVLEEALERLAPALA